MTEQEQRIAIAEACGITICPCCLNEIDPMFCHCGGNIKSHDIAFGHSAVPDGCTCGYADQTKVAKNTAPNYPQDLNAMHEVEKKLTAIQSRQYAREIGSLIVKANKDEFWIDHLGSIETYTLHATAQQRAIAFLKTLNKWKD